MDIQVFENEGQLNAYAFFDPAYHEKNPLPQPYNEPVQGYFYLVTIPRKLAEHPVEYRMAEQTWGRICSICSPPITKPSKVE